VRFACLADMPVERGISQLAGMSLIDLLRHRATLKRTVSYVLTNFTVFKWLLHQPYFLLSLGVSYLIYRSNKDRFLAVGLGIIIWGLMKLFIL
jgi:hypothetical protein